MKDWHLRFAANMLNYQGYSIGKLLGLINDPAIISLAGGLPSPDMFLRAELQMATRQRLDRDIHTTIGRHHDNRHMVSLRPDLS